VRVSAHQSAYLPWLGYLAKIAWSDVFILFDAVPMESSGYENRNRVLTNAGPQWLTVPVQRSRGTLIKDVLICNDQPWARKHFRALELAYGKAPFWSRYAPRLEALYAKKWRRLIDLNWEVMTFFGVAYELQSPKVCSLSHLDLTSKKSQLVLDACKRVGATSYLFGEMGLDYADVGAFKAAGVEVLVQEYQAREYPQQFGGWTPNLSALDALLNLGPERARQVMLAGGKVRVAA